MQGRKQDRKRMSAILCLAILQMGLQVSDSEPIWETICEAPGSCKVLSSIVYLDSRRFTTASLTRFFSPYLRYDERVEIQLIVVSDRRLLHEEPGPPVPFSLDRLPDIEPVKVPGPVALFRKIGRAAFFEFRDKLGRIERVSLSGPDVFSPVIAGYRPVVVGDYFSSHATSNPNSDCLADTVRHVVVVVPNLKDMSPDQLTSVCRFYAHHLRPIPFEMRIYGSFQEAGCQRRFDFPALEALAGGFSTPSKPGRTVLFTANEGRGSLVVIEDGRPILRTQVEQ
jgi:hypothetical protein